MTMVRILEPITIQEPISEQKLVFEKKIGQKQPFLVERPDFGTKKKTRLNNLQQRDREALVGGEVVGRLRVGAAGARQLRGSLRVPGVPQGGREAEEPIQARAIRRQTGMIKMWISVRLYQI